MGTYILKGPKHTCLVYEFDVLDIPVAFLSQVRDDVAIYGFAYDVNTGELEEVTHDPAKTGNQP